jgi:glucose dehydrogenase
MSTRPSSEILDSLIGRATLSLVVLVATGLLVTACGSSSSTDGCHLRGAVAASNPAASATAAPSGSWPYSNADLANTRLAPGSAISAANVSGLEQAWAFKLAGKAAVGVPPYGSLVSNPIVDAGVVYVQDIESNVYALGLATGSPRWEYVCNQPVLSGPGPNGVAVVNGTVYGLTPTAAFALNAATGKTMWVNSRLVTKSQGIIGIQPQVADGRVYLASQYGSAPGGGVLLALKASSGAVLWKFNTAVGPDPGVQALGLGSGGAWETPLVGNDGSVTYGTGNPYQTAAAAIAHPAALLYTDSAVNINAATGKLRWYYQGVPNDFNDHDMQASPVSARVNGVPVVIGSGKMGYVYEMNADTGKLIWKSPVGKHNGHDNESLQALEHTGGPKAPDTIEPGPLGGVLTNLAVADNSVYVVTIDLPLTYTSLSLPSPNKSAGPATGEAEALNLATGKVQWDTKVPQLPLGAATVSNDLVFTTLYNGMLLAFDRRTGRIVYRRQLPTSTNAPIAIAGNTVIVAAGGPRTRTIRGNPQVIAYTLR